MKKLSGFILLLALEVSGKEVSYNYWLEKEIESFSTQERVFEKTLGSWSLDKVIFRVRPLVGVEVPFLASLEIKPFIEFYWDP